MNDLFITTYEIAPIYNKTFLTADPVLRRHIVRIGILEYEKGLMEMIELADLEDKTKDIVQKIQGNRKELVEEYDALTRYIGKINK